MPNSPNKARSFATPSTPPSPPPGVSMIDWLTARARPEAEAKAREHTRKLLQDQAELDLRVERCVLMTEALLVETRAFLGQPAKLPKQLLSPVEYVERNQSAGQKLARVTADAAMADSERLYESVMALLTLQEARRTALPPSPREGAFLRSFSDSRTPESSEAGSDELESAEGSSTSVATDVKGKAVGMQARQWQNIAAMDVEMRWSCALQ
ncbi:hypothetical protein LTR85_004317 [Meristemomyces frigidus]|nr:hypothetical protein LTR85_004317 [Meristemomyces frigidus]